MAEVVAEGDAFVCLMHMQGEPRTMQAAPQYDDVVSDVLAFLEERVAFAVDHGIREERICIDPGIGFGKTADHNLELLRRLDELTALGRPLVVGVSRKSTLAKIVGRASSDPAIAPACVGAAVSAFDRGAWMIRAHDVRETVAALAVASAVERGKIAT
jgi:dihydropteroate synthase